MAMLASASLLAICGGVVCLRDSDLAWQIYEWDCRMLSMMPPRLKNWRARVKQVGYALIGLGILGVVASMSL